MSDYALRPRRASEVIDLAVRLVRNNLGPALTLGALAALPGIAVQLVMNPTQPGAVRGAGTGAMFGTTIVVGLLVGIAVAALVGGATFILGDEALRGGRPSVGDAFAKALPRVPALLAVGIGTTFLIGIGFALFVVPGIYLMLRLVAAFPAAALEDVGPDGAIRESLARTKGRAWHVFKTLVLTALVYAVPLVLASMVGGVIAGIVGWRAANTGQLPTASFAIIVVLQFAVAAFAYPFLWFALLVLYYDLRVRAEGYDLEAMAAELDAVPMRAAAR